MKLIDGVGNGFAITEYEVREKEQREDLLIEILNDGICIGTNFYNNISFEERDRLVALYIAMEMDVFGIDDSPLLSEKLRFAKKIMNLGIINDYKLVLTKKEKIDCEVKFLVSGKFLMSTHVHGLSPDGLVKLQKKLNNIKQFQLDVKHQTRPLYAVEILSIID